MVDAGRQRLDPSQTRCTAEHEIPDFDAEHDHDVDVGEVAGHFASVTEQRELQRGKLLAKPVAVHFGMNIDDKDFDHAGGRPR